MKKIITSLHYLGNIYYYAKLLHADEIIIEKQEYFVKATNRNRCCITGANGLMMLTIPIQHGRSHKMVFKETQSALDNRWKAIHWHSIISAYKHAPFFEHYAPYFEKYFADNKQEYIFDFNTQLLQVSLKLLKCATPLQFTELYEKDIETSIEDCRNKSKTTLHYPEYTQVFAERNGFTPNLSILDLLFNKGNEAKSYLLSLKV